MKWIASILLVLLTLRLAAEDPPIQATTRQADTINIAVSDDGQFVGTLDHRCQLSVWDARSGRLLESNSNWLSFSTQLAFSADGRYLSCSAGGGGKVWDWRNRRVVYSTPENAMGFGIAMDSARKRLFLQQSNQLWMRALDGGAQTGPFKLGEVGQIAVTGIEVAASGELMLLCRKTGILRFDPERKEIVPRIDPGYPTLPLFDEDAIRKKPELALMTKIDGVPGWRVARSREQVLITLSGQSHWWVKTVGATQESLSAPIPLKISSDHITWLGKTGKFVTVTPDAKFIEWIDPADPGTRRKLPVALPPVGGIARIDCDAEGRTLVIASDKGWFCFEGDPTDPTSWKARNYP